MHRIYSESDMQAKANAIRRVCNLPSTEKMTPPEMADKLLQFAADPGLVYTVNDYVNGASGVAIPSVRLMHAAFDHYKMGNLDFDIYNKLMITFKISNISVTYNQTYDIDDLNVGIAEAQGAPDSSIANNPLRPILYVGPIHKVVDSNKTNWLRNKMSIIDVYKSSTDGIVYAFSKFKRLETPSLSWNTGDLACAVERQLKHLENKNVSIIFYKNQPDDYTVLVDGEFAFSDKRIEADRLSDFDTHYISAGDVGMITVGDYPYGLWQAPGPNVSDYGFGPYDNRPSYSYPFGYNQRCDIDYDSIVIKYIK